MDKLILVLWVLLAVLVALCLSEKRRAAGGALFGGALFGGAPDYVGFGKGKYDGDEDGDGDGDEGDDSKHAGGRSRDGNRDGSRDGRPRGTGGPRREDGLLVKGFREPAVGELINGKREYVARLAVGYWGRLAKPKNDEENTFIAKSADNKVKVTVLKATHHDSFEKAFGSLKLATEQSKLLPGAKPGGVDAAFKALSVGDPASDAQRKEREENFTKNMTEYGVVLLKLKVGERVPMHAPASAASAAPAAPARGAERNSAEGSNLNQFVVSVDGSRP